VLARALQQLNAEVRRRSMAEAHLLQVLLSSFFFFISLEPGVE